MSQYQFHNFIYMQSNKNKHLNKPSLLQVIYRYTSTLVVQLLLVLKRSQYFKDLYHRQTESVVLLSNILDYFMIICLTYHISFDMKCGTPSLNMQSSEINKSFVLVLKVVFSSTLNNKKKNM